jgi:leucyl-tRNA synthetase
MDASKRGATCATNTGNVLSLEGYMIHIARQRAEDTTTITTDTATSMDNAAAEAAAAADAANKRGTAKRDALRAHERAIQAAWEEARVYQSDKNGKKDAANKESFLVTFPYPYMNGVLHIGHAFSLTKAVFRAQYERHLGKNVLFPFAFHCTGMPIQAVR